LLSWNCLTGRWRCPALIVSVFSCPPSKPESLVQENPCPTAPSAGSHSKPSGKVRCRLSGLPPDRGLGADRQYRPHPGISTGLQSSQSLHLGLWDLTMRCLRCHRVLVDPDSILRRSGPVCWAKIQAADIALENPFQNWVCYDSPEPSEINKLEPEPQGV
jgi:hypothetical protein